MAFSIGNGRYRKLFPGNAPPKRVLIKDLSEPGLLSRAFIQGLCKNTRKLQENYCGAWEVVLHAIFA